MNIFSKLRKQENIMYLILCKQMYKSDSQFCNPPKCCVHKNTHGYTVCISLYKWEYFY